MKVRTRWIKIIKDVLGNRPRSLLVILSIAVGVATIGMINQGVVNMRTNLFEVYDGGNPTSITLHHSPAGEELAGAVEAMRAVKDARPRRQLAATAHLADGRSNTINLHTIPDYGDVQVDRYQLAAGADQPGLRGITVERQAANELGIKVGDVINVELATDEVYALRVDGIFHTLYYVPYNVTDSIEAYATMDTLQWMGRRPTYDRLDLVVAEEVADRQHVLDVAGEARDRVIEPAGFTVHGVDVPGYNADPGEHWAQSQINGFVLVLQVMSVLAIFLSGGLVVNTIAAILNQQIKQIGIMRAIGATRAQLIRMYLVKVMVFGVAGLAVGLPLGLVGALGLTRFVASFLNFDIISFTPDVTVTLIQIAVGLLMPLTVALFPILAGARISVYNAIYHYGLVGDEAESWIERILTRVRSLKNPIVALALRNTFRKKARLVFTLITLTLAGAMFVAVFSTRSSLNAQISQVTRYTDFDATLGVSAAAKRTTVEREALRIPGVTVAEGWAATTGEVVSNDGSEGEEIQLISTDPHTQTIDPLLIDGRWLREEDGQHVVVNEDLLEQVPTARVGTAITLRVGDRERTLQIVGITSKHLSGPRAYLIHRAYNKISDRPNVATAVRVRLEADGIGGPADQERVATMLEERFESAQLSSSDALTQDEIFGNFTKPFDIILIVLVIMASVLAVVGGLSLTGTMGMNVMERTREIGVLRAVGANNAAIRQVVVIEGVMVGLISWLLALIISAPSARALAGAVVQVVFETGVSFRYSLSGLLVWLTLVVMIGVGASLAPARRAALLTVREVLDYE